MLRRTALVVGFLMIGGCASTPPQPVVWYILSPRPTADYPHGSINTPISTWERLKEFPTQNDCQSAIQDMHNQVHRPMNCVASNDPRMTQ